MCVFLFYDGACGSEGRGAAPNREQDIRDLLGDRFALKMSTASIYSP